MRTLCVLASVAAAMHAQSPFDEFARNVERYMALAKRAGRGLPGLKPTESAEAIARQERALAARIRAQRASARRGDIFTPAAEAEFRRLIAHAMQGEQAAQIGQTLKHGEPVRARLRVNDTYPPGIPRQTVPPSLLLNLPKLPSELEYAIIGRDLVLHDIKANLVVDFIPNAIREAAR